VAERCADGAVRVEHSKLHVAVLTMAAAEDGSSRGWQQQQKHVVVLKETTQLAGTAAAKPSTHGHSSTTAHSHRLWLQRPRAIWQRRLAVGDEENVQAGVQAVVLLLHTRLWGGG
jgi:hypothetical protein